MPDVKPVPRWLRAANRAALALSRIGLTMGPVCVLTVPGRRTGKPRSAPVSPLRVGGGRYVVSALPDSDWARNVRAAGHAELSRGRHREPVTLTEVTDSTLKEQVMRAYPREVPKAPRCSPGPASPPAPTPTPSPRPPATSRYSRSARRRQRVETRMRHGRSGDRCPGDIGGAVLAGLAAAGEPVRASSRAPRPGEFPGGVEVARLDLSDPASSQAALAGAAQSVPLRASRRRGAVRGGGAEGGRGARGTAVLQHGAVP